MLFLATKYKVSSVDVWSDQQTGNHRTLTWLKLGSIDRVLQVSSGDAKDHLHYQRDRGSQCSTAEEYLQSEGVSQRRGSHQDPIPEHRQFHKEMDEASGME